MLESIGEEMRLFLTCDGHRQDDRCLRIEPGCFSICLLALLCLFEGSWGVESASLIRERRMDGWNQTDGTFLWFACLREFGVWAFCLLLCFALIPDCEFAEGSSLFL